MNLTAHNIVNNSAVTITNIICTLFICAEVTLIIIFVPFIIYFSSISMFCIY
jgi:hypothetical protein